MTVTTVTMRLKMKRVIEIDKDYYELLKYGVYCGDDYLPIKIIANSTALEPSGDLISRQAVFDINESHHGQMPNHINHQIWQEIKELPSVNPQEPKIGHWIKKADEICFTCTNCWSTNPSGIKYKYCPNCGARMVEPQESEG